MRNSIEGAGILVQVLHSLLLFLTIAPPSLELRTEAASIPDSLFQWKRKQCDKNDCRGVLVELEGVTGKKTVASEAMTVKN
jgi:hypothetical protein